MKNTLAALLVVLVAVLISWVAVPALLLYGLALLGLVKFNLLNLFAVGCVLAGIRVVLAWNK